MLKLIVYCADQSAFESQKAALLKTGFENGQIIFGDADSKTREQLINENLNSWILFLDHDCLPTNEAKTEAEHIVTAGRKEAVVFAGAYLNPLNSSALQRAHNKIANTWLEQSYAEHADQPALLGGVFLIYAARGVDLPVKKFWGAEDKLLAVNLKKSGYLLQLSKKLFVVHDTSKSFGHFIRRAVLHGRNDAIYFEKSGNFRISYWIQKIDFSDLRSAFLILLHFCIQKAAKATQTVLLTNKR